MRILETERLTLRKMTMDDEDHLLGILSDAVAMRYYPQVYDREGTRAWIQRQLDRYAKTGIGLWIVELKETGEFIGQVGPMYADVDGQEEIEIAWLLLRKHWGKGYATEAAAACREYAFGKLGRDRVIAFIRPENTPSRRVAERLGMTVWKETMKNEIRHLVYENQGGSSIAVKVAVECIPCYLTQCINVMEKGKVPKDQQAVHLTGLLAEVAQLDQSLTPAENSTIVLHKLVERLGGLDPFAEAKKESNRLALEQLPRLARMVREAADPLYAALQFSVAGNVVDLGILEDYDLDKAINDVLQHGFARSDYHAFRRLLDAAETVFIIGDNSGEIVFDRLLVEELLTLGKKVVYGVKGGFVLNDATMEDAHQAGLDEIVQVVDSGCNYLGTLEDKCSEEFVSLLRGTDVIIGKGQANYESLEGTSLAGDKTFFLLKAKCPLLAEHLKVKYGDLVFVRNR